jgi:exopolysaccharide biosynthesis polyprenyl glycosylphosphotransferase
VPVGFVDCAVDGLDDAPRDLPVLGDLPALAWIVSQLGVRRAVVAFGGHREHEMVDAMRECARLGVATYVVPRFFELGVCPDGASTDRIWGMRLVYARPPLSTTTGRAAKRALDIAVAGTVLVFASPLFLVAAIATKLSSPGPIFFKQRRVGRGGAAIDVLKFRSMRVNDESDTAWSVPEERITRVGKFLRDTSIDELPQLLTVLRGDMSVVGPRPERQYFVDQFNDTVEHYDDRHRVPAGLSGWAQVHGLRGDTSIEDRVQFDNDYIEHWSIWLDVMILVRTATAVIRGAFSKGSPDGDPLR